MTWFASLHLIGLPSPNYEIFNTILAAPLNSLPPRRKTRGHLTFHTVTLPCKTPLASAEMTILVTGNTYFASSGKLAYTNYNNLIITHAPPFSSGDQQFLVVLQPSTNLMTWIAFVNDFIAHIVVFSISDISANCANEADGQADPQIPTRLSLAICRDKCLSRWK